MLMESEIVNTSISSSVALRTTTIMGDVWLHDSSLSCRVVRAARHVRRAERSGGQQSEGDGERYYTEALRIH
jgi:hypothetical protein